MEPRSPTLCQTWAFCPLVLLLPFSDTGTLCSLDQEGKCVCASHGTLLEAWLLSGVPARGIWINFVELHPASTRLMNPGKDTTSFGPLCLYGRLVMELWGTERVIVPTTFTHLVTGEAYPYHGSRDMYHTNGYVWLPFFPPPFGPNKNPVVKGVLGLWVVDGWRLIYTTTNISLNVNTYKNKCMCIYIYMYIIDIYLYPL